MLNWKKFGVDDNELDGISKLIVERLGDVSAKFFRYKKKPRSKRTRLVSVTLTRLGDEILEGKPRYHVMSHSLPPWMTQKKRRGKKRRGKFKNVEWLYDLHWYSEVKNPTCYKLLRMHLVVEYEWDWTRTDEKKEKDGKKDKYGAIKYDFQKLLVANADLRLMIYRIADEARRSDLDEYFENVIENYHSLRSNSEFLFIAFDEKAKTFHYAAYQRLAGGCDCHCEAK
jgi:hypothetical protein